MAQTVMIMAGLMSYSSEKHMTDISISIIIIIDHDRSNVQYISSASQHQQATSNQHSIRFDIDEQMLEYFSTLQFYASGLR